MALFMKKNKMTIDQINSKPMGRVQDYHYIYYDYHAVALIFDSKMPVCSSLVPFGPYHHFDILQRGIVSGEGEPIDSFAKGALIVLAHQIAVRREKQCH